MATYQKVLCPIDFSEASYKGLRVAYDFANYYKAQLILVHVVSFPAPNTMGYPTEWEAEQFAVHEAKRGLNQAIDEILPRGANATAVVKLGDAALEIEKVAEAENAGIIVMSTHGRKGWRRLVYGSVATAVLRSVHLPVLAVSAAPGADLNLEMPERVHLRDDQNGAEAQPNALPFRRILCASDLSEFSMEAVGIAAGLAKDADAELCIVHVIEPLDPALGVVSAKEFNEARISDAALEVNEAIRSRIGKGERFRVAVRIGSPAGEILKLAREEQADLIAIATHGASGWRQFAFGSVAEQIMQASPQLVLLTGGRLESAKHEAADGACTTHSA